MVVMLLHGEVLHLFFHKEKEKRKRHVQADLHVLALALIHKHTLSSKLNRQVSSYYLHSLECRM